MSNLPLPQFYAQTLAQVAPILDDTLSIVDPSVQSTLSSALNELHLIGRMITSLGVFSENEGVEEIGDGELRFMSLGWVVGECEGKLGLGGRDDRTQALRKSEVSSAPWLRYHDDADFRPHILSTYLF
jgi:immunoglobulin-binding protein 1